METAYIKRYNKIHCLKKETPIHNKTVKQHISTLFRPLPEISGYQPKLIDPHYEHTSFWKDDRYDQGKLEYNHNFSKPPKQIEDDDIITDSHVSDKLKNPLIDFWTLCPQLPKNFTISDFWITT